MLIDAWCDAWWGVALLMGVWWGCYWVSIIVMVMNVCVSMRICDYECMFMCICDYVCIFYFVCLCVCVCVCVFICVNIL